MSAWMLFGVALGGAAGAVCRDVLGRTLNRSRVAWGTVVANGLGSAVLGAVIAAVQVNTLNTWWSVALGAGVAGGLSTFSTLAVDVVRAWRAGERAGVALYLAATIVAGAVAAWAGFTIVSRALG